MENPLLTLYGENVFEDAMQEIDRLKAVSNIPFNKEYVRLGISFMQMKANEIVEGKKKHCSLNDLVSRSFGEAAVATYNRW